MMKTGSEINMHEKDLPRFRANPFIFYQTAVRTYGFVGLKNIKSEVNIVWREENTDAERRFESNTHGKRDQQTKSSLRVFPDRDVCRRPFDEKTVATHSSGQIAGFSHQDLDETAAQELIEKNVLAILNARPTFSGYETKGAWYLLEAGIPVFDLCQPLSIRQFVDGMTLWLTEHIVGCWNGEEPRFLAAVQRLTRDVLNQRWQTAKANRLATFIKFAENTWVHAFRDFHQLMRPTAQLALKTGICGRDAVIVVRGPHYKRDLEVLLPS